MNVKSFYGSKPQTFLALVPEDPQDSEAELSDDDDIIGDRDYLPKQAELIGDLSFASMNEEEMPSTSTSAKKKKKGEDTLKTVSMEEPDDTPDPRSPPGSKKKKMTEKKEEEAGRIWKHVDTEEFQVPDSTSVRHDAVKTPFQYFKMLFTDEMIQHIAHHTNLHSAQELGDPIKTSPGEIEDFLAMLLLMGVFNFPAMEDYWHPESRFNVIADIMPKKRFMLLRRYIHFNDNQHCDGSPDLCISNSWLVYKRDCGLLKEKPMPLKRFRLAVAHSLKQINKPAPRVGRPSSASPPRASIVGRPSSTSPPPTPRVGQPSSASPPPAPRVGQPSSASPPAPRVGQPSSASPPAPRVGQPSSASPPAPRVGQPSSASPPAPRVGRPSSASPPQMSCEKKRLPPRPPRPQPDVRYDNYGHWPLHTDNRGRCSLCPKGVSRWKCGKCNVFLCLIGERECFVAYHQK